MTTMTKARNTEQAEALGRLREWVKPGDTLYTQLKSVSRSGMSRVIQVLKMENNEPRYLGYNIALALDWRYDRNKEGLKVSGCGMDMGFHVVYTLGQALWPNGTPTPHGTRNGEPDSAGGYAIKQRWL